MTSESMDLPNEPAKLPASAHFLCGWPLLMVAIGGAIGGGLGGVAYAINLSIYKSKMHLVAKIMLNLLVGMAAFGIWLAVAIGIQSDMKR